MATAVDPKQLKIGMLVALALGLACLALINLVVAPRLAAERATPPGGARVQPAAAVAQAEPDAASVARAEPDAAAVAQAEPDAAAVAQAEPDAAAVAPVGSSMGGGAPLPAEIRFQRALIWLKPRYTKLLDAVAKAMRRDEGLHLLVRGHADARGGRSYNARLARKRSQSIVYYLRRKGISPGRVSMRSYGALVPAAPGKTREAWAQNRRVELSWRP